MTDPTDRIYQCLTQPRRAIAIMLQQMVGVSLRRSRPNARQAA
jgi:hypothetical protein